MKKIYLAAVTLLTVLCMLATWISPMALSEAPKAENTASEHMLSYRPTLISKRLAQTDQNRTFTLPDNLPTAYSSLDEGYMTPIKDQQQYGVCWAFAMLACGETATLKEHLTDNPSPDYSEFALSYQAYHSVTDPLGGLAGDNVAITGSAGVEGETDLNRYLLVGGDYERGSLTLFNWRGATDEALAPYSAVVANSELAPDDSTAYEDVLHLEDVIWLPLNSEESAMEVKARLLEHGAAGLTIYMNQECMNEENGSYYCGDATDAAINHGVVLCGWDDDYPATNFGTEKGGVPSRNGAWLVRNSWGNWGGYDGYFWMSYEDVTFSLDNQAAFFTFAPADKYDYNYQYDGHNDPCFLKQEGTKHGFAANVFTAEHDEQLKATSNVYYNQSGGAYTVRVYRGLTDNADPTSGELVAEKTVTDVLKGIHTDVLDTPVELTAGTTFSVVYELSTPDDANLVTCRNETYSLETLTFEYVNEGELGQSFYSFDGSAWHDTFDPAETNVEAKGANFRIHAYTTVPDSGETSENPSEEPSEEPSDDPWVVSEIDEFSDMPSEEPSEVLSEEPSEVPSEEPSEVPSEEPSEVTSEEPSEVTSEEPSEEPSDISETSEVSEVSEISEVSEQPAVAGDADGDGEATMKDVLLARKLIAGMDVEVNEGALDVDGDGDVTMKDVLLIRKFIAGLIERLGVPIV